MSLLLVGLGVVAYLAMSAALLDEIDSGLRFRAAATATSSPTGAVETQDPRLQEPDEAFDQLLTSSGQVLRASPGIARPLLDPRELARLTYPLFIEQHVPNVVGTARLLAVPLGLARSRVVLIVGTTMTDRSDALSQLGDVLAIGGAAAITLACLAGWIVAGWALYPMERMRQQAAAITASGLDHRLTVPPAHDELQHLAHTLNDMLARLDHSLNRERAFLERASHELRTPLAALRAEVDLALRHRRTAEELTAALHSVSAETERLTRLAQDLLVLARAHNGRLPLHREVISLRATLHSTAALFTARALASDISLSVDASDERINADPLRLRQALDNLVDNALRYTPRHGTVQLTASITDNAAHIVISDSGPGFADPVEVGEASQETLLHRGSPGLGLRIVRAVVASHKGSIHIRPNANGGAAIELTLPR